MSELKLMTVQMCTHVKNCPSHPSYYKDRMPNRLYYTPPKVEVAEYALEQLEAAMAKDNEIHESNKTALETNRAIKDRITELMDSFGFPRSYTEPDPKSRARIPKRITHKSGYLQDIKRWCVTDDGYSCAVLTYDRLKKTYEDYLAEAQKEKEEEKRQAELERKLKKDEREKLLSLAEIILRYDLDKESEWEDILDELRHRDQRLDLAIAMLDTRNYWGDGPYKVEYALGRFTPKNEEDREIFDNVSETLARWGDEMDGRIFRDCYWNYDRILNSIEDQQLRKDALTAHKWARDW